MRNYSGPIKKEKHNLFYRHWPSSCAFNYNIQFFTLIKLSQGQREIEFAFFVGTFWLALEVGRCFLCVKTEYASRGNSDLGTKFNC